MGYPFLLKEVSEMLDIPVTTLRYWEKQELIHLQRNINNNYKEFFFDDLAYVCDIDIYHNLGLKKNELKDLYSLDITKIDEFLNTSDQRIHKEINELYATLDKIRQRRRLLEKIKQTAEGDYVLSEINIEKAVSISDSKIDLIKHGKQLLNDFITITSFIPGEPDFSYGFTVPADFPFGTVIFEKTSSAKKYISFLMKIPLEHVPFPYESENFEPFLKPHSDKITKLYAPPKKILCQFLLTAYDEELDTPCFYESVWVEL